MKIFENVQALTESRLTAGQIVETKGYYTVGDGGGGRYLIEAAGAVFDGFGNHQLANLNVATLQNSGPVDILQFGADKTGAAPSTAEIQAAIDSLPATGGAVFFPKGTYLVTSSLIVTNDTHLYGESMNGSKIMIGTFVADGYKDAVIQTETEINVSRVVINELTIDGQGGSGASHAIKFFNPVQLNIENVYIRQSTGTGLRIKNPLIVSLDNIYVNAPQSYAFSFQLDSDTGIIRAGSLIADNGQNVPAVYCTQTTQANCTFLVDTLRFEGGWSVGAFIESFTQISDNSIYFEAGSIRAFSSPNGSAVDACICEIHNNTRYRIGEVSGSNPTSWPYIFAQYNGTRPNPLSGATYVETANIYDGLTNGDTKYNLETKNFESLGQVNTVRAYSKFSGGYTGNVVELQSDSSTGLSNSNFLRCLSGASTEKALILGDGSFQSATNSYGAISDETLKDIIGPARDYTADLKLLDLIKYTLKDDPDSVEMLGLVAQQVESIMPGLVTTNDEGIKSLKYSVINLMMLDVMQRVLKRLDDAGL